jgi:hypothetical protein
VSPQPTPVGDRTAVTNGYLSSAEVAADAATTAPSTTTSLVGSQAGGQQIGASAPRDRSRAEATMGNLPDAQELQASV